MRMSDKITMRPVEALIPYARKTATHSKAQVAQIAGSIREFGFTKPAPDDGENEIIAGHGRVLAARKSRCHWRCLATANTSRWRCPATR